MALRIYIDQGREAMGHYSKAPRPSRRIFFNAREFNSWFEFARYYEERMRDRKTGMVHGFADAWKFETVDEMRRHYG